MNHDSLANLDKSYLPAVAQELAEAVGLPKALRLVETLGGTTFPVPKRETKQGELRFAVLADVVGVEAAEVLVRRYGSTDLYIPKCAEAMRRLRDAAIIQEYDALIRKDMNGRKGISGNEAVQRLARSHRLSDRQIFNILKREPVSTVNVGGAVQLKLLG